MSAPEYPIGTLREMCAIPEEALPRFLAELPTILGEARRAYAALDAISAADLGIEMALDGSPKRVDDDLNQVTLSARIEGQAEAFATVTGKRQ